MTGALELGALLAARELDAVALCEETLERCAATGPAFIALTPERARAEAAASAARLRAGTPAGPLDGVPVAWKDLADVAGVRSTWGSATRADAPAATRDAPAVAQLAAAGMVCVGKTNLSELAFSGLGLNPHFGTPDNPAAPGRIPGGSSSGSAVAVAAGAVPVAIGTDTAGSIRIPAALCGIVGFKPSVARVSRDGVQALSPAMDSVGPLARTVDDAIAVDAALRGAPVVLPAAAAPRLVVAEGDVLDGADPLVRDAFEAAVARLAAAGLDVVRRPVRALDDVQALFDRCGSIVAAEACAVHADLLRSADAERLDPRVLARLRGGAAVRAQGYGELVRSRAAAQTALSGDLDGALLLTPAVREVAPALAPLDADPERFATTNLRMLRTTMLLSYLDAPGVVLPLATSADAPTGLLLSGPPQGDDVTLAGARTVAAALGLAASGAA